MRWGAICIAVVFSSLALAQPAGPVATAPAGKLPHLEVDVKARQVRVECQTLGVDAPLEFFCVATGTSEHESVVRSPVKASHLHLALLMVGLEPGEPVRYSQAAQRWLPPHGPPLHITMEYQKDGKTIRDPAHRWMRNIETKQPMPPMTWIFVGSRVMEDGNYAADVTGYLVSIVNFELSVIDIPQLASNSNETLQWERNPDLVPQAGTMVTMIIEPAGKTIAPATTRATEGEAQASADDGQTLSAVTIDEQRIAQLRQRWQKAVQPHDQALREAAQTHYEVISALRSEQQRLIDEADRIQRLINELEKSYQDMTTPRPELP